MRWSELRKRVESEFAEDIRDRVSVHVTRHHEISRSGRGWITIDGVEIANFCDWSVYYPNPDHRPSHKDALAAYGELRAWDFKVACWSLIHEGVDPALASGEPLRIASDEQLHPLVRHFVQLRLGACEAAPNNSFKPKPLRGSA